MVAPREIRKWITQAYKSCQKDWMRSSSAGLRVEVLGNIKYLTFPPRKDGFLIQLLWLLVLGSLATPRRMVNILTLAKAIYAATRRFILVDIVLCMNCS